MTIETFLACVTLLGTLQGAYIVLRNAEAKPAANGGYWANDNSDFTVVSDEERMARKMKSDFDLARAKSIMAMAEHFAGPRAKA